MNGEHNKYLSDQYAALGLTAADPAQAERGDFEELWVAVRELNEARIQLEELAAYLVGPEPATSIAAGGAVAKDSVGLFPSVGSAAREAQHIAASLRHNITRINERAR